MNNWDIYQTGINGLGALYLVILFNNPVPLLLDVSMALFFGWFFGVGFLVWMLEGGTE